MHLFTGVCLVIWVLNFLFFFFLSCFLRVRVSGVCFTMGSSAAGIGAYIGVFLLSCKACFVLVLGLVDIRICYYFFLISMPAYLY